MKVKKVPVFIEESSEIDRTNEPVKLGIPLPRGSVKKGDPLTLTNSSGEAVPLQAAPLAFWPDQSVKWMLLDFQVSVQANEVSRHHLSIGADPLSDAKGIAVVRYDNGLKVDTGVTSYYLDGKIFIPFSRVISDGIDVVDGSSSRVALIDGDGNEYEPGIDKLSVETPGNLRTAIKIEGAFRRENRTLARFVSRIHFFANKSFVRIDLTLWNSRPARHTGGLWDLGDPGSILFKDLSLRITLNSDNEVSIQWTTQPNEAMRSTTFTPLNGETYLTGANDPSNSTNSTNLVIYQDSSGGENWRSSNHINRLGKVPLSFKGYQVRDGEGVITHGLRANPLIFIGDGKRGISGAIQKFWQNFPKALQVEGNSIYMRLFPEFFGDLHELQGGEKKTHTVFLDFSGKPHALNWVHDPLAPVIPPKWYSETKTFPYLSVNPSHRDDRYETLIETVLKGDNTFFHRREVIDEYGWRNFGDVYADHEGTGHSGTAPLVSHYNNQYDLIYSFIRQWVSKSDLSWYEMANDLARHVVDIDIYHTNRDREEFNGSMFWHTNHYLDAGTCTHRSVSKEHLKFVDPRFCGGGPGLEHNYTTGLLFHYYLTGNISSKDAVLGLAEWVMRNIDGPNTLLGTLYDFKKKMPRWKKGLGGVKVASAKYPFTRGSGNSINALLDAYALTKHDPYLRKAEKIIKGCVHPKDDIESRDLLNAELSWSYTVFLQAIGKYLDIKLEINEIDSIYCYARNSLLHYAEWMLEHEYPYLEKPEILEYPNETWPAQDMRKSCVFYFAAKHVRPDLRKSFMDKADFFFNYSVQKLRLFDTKCLTRPIALLLQNGWMHSYFIDNPDEVAPFVKSGLNFSHTAELLSPRTMIKQVVRDITKAFAKTSIKKEIHWLKCRCNRHV